MTSEGRMREIRRIEHYEQEITSWAWRFPYEPKREEENPWSVNVDVEKKRHRRPNVEP